MTEMALPDLLRELIRMPGTFILRNAHGSMELDADDLYLSPAGEWITLYHQGVSNPESKSHLHLRWKTLRAARIEREEGETPHLAFYAATTPDGEPLLLWYFPSFYDYEKGKAEIPANVARYDAFVKQHGSAVRFA